MTIIFLSACSSSQGEIDTVSCQIAAEILSTQTAGAPIPTLKIANLATPISPTPNLIEAALTQQILIPQIGSTVVSDSDRMVLVYVPEGRFRRKQLYVAKSPGPEQNVYLDAYMKLSTFDRDSLKNHVEAGAHQFNQPMLTLR